MVGEDGLEEELGLVGLRVVKEEARPAAGMTEDEFREHTPDPEVWSCWCNTWCCWCDGGVTADSWVADARMLSAVDGSLCFSFFSRRPFWCGHSGVVWVWVRLCGGVWRCSGGDKIVGNFVSLSLSVSCTFASNFGQRHSRPENSF